MPLSRRASRSGWRLTRSAWGSGYASEAARIAITFAFDRGGLDEIVSFTGPANGRSIAVMERAPGSSAIRCSRLDTRSRGTCSIGSVGDRSLRLRGHSRTLAQSAALSVETANRHYSASGGSVRRVTLSLSDVAAIRGAETALADAFEAADPTAWVDFYTEDATFVGPGMPEIEGRDALLSAAPSVVISSMEIVADSTIGAGDFAATQGRANWVSGPKGSDGPRVRRRFLMVWRRDVDGRWRIARELLNEDV